MSVYAIARCDVCGAEKSSPVNHINESAYWHKLGGRRPIGWEYHRAHTGDSAASVLFCDECEAEVEKGTDKKVKEMIAKITR